MGRKEGIYKPNLIERPSYGSDRKRKSVFKWLISSSIYLLVIIVIGAYSLLNLLLQSENKTFHGYNVSIVISGSMEPTIKVKSFIITKAQERYYVGDVVNFVTKKDSFTHRIVSIGFEEYESLKDLSTEEQAAVVKENGKYRVYSYETKGDNNNVPDEWVINNSNINGKLVFQSYFIGAGLLTMRKIPTIYYVSGIIVLILLISVLSHIFGKVSIEELTEVEKHKLNKLKMKKFVKYIKKVRKGKKVKVANENFELVKIYFEQNPTQD